ncbi:2-C-methyl-D-erythritol 2,4-cyclodiphosphate synthase [bacterium]|nr:2-C-methyl-D-erythritol 2,4-cyclodiphosphate synthase [bacterium]
MLRIGLGYDVHAFVEGRPLVLGGVAIPNDRGLAGHSDADVLTHALMDALLGAMRAGDIGAHFPDTDDQYAGISSLELLRRVSDIARDGGWTLVDADCVLVAEWPKITPYREEMRASLASCLGVDIECIGVKATTTEGLGFAGRGEGVAAQAVVLMERASLERNAASRPE